MKSYTFIAVLAIAAISFTSCKRSYNCACYSPSLNRSTPAFEIKDTKKKAKEQCESQPLTGAYTGTDYICRIQ
ncbi:MAG: hypothetical protein H6550_12040 [Chitinophagales bacterium]|nr:hypothetical protein [Chitinophagales bacterium]